MPIKIKSVSGSVTLSAENASGDQTLTIPSLSGGKTLLTSDGSGASLTNLPAASADSYFASSGLSSKDLGDGLHIKTGDSGASANANFSSLVIEDDTHSGISILSGASSDGAIYFGDSGGVGMGQIKYQHNTNQLVFEVNQAGALTLTSDGRGLSQFTAKAWVNFNGTGTVAVRDSHNISSVSDGGVGNYVLNFSNNMANVNYTTQITCGWPNWDSKPGLGTQQVHTDQVYTMRGDNTTLGLEDNADIHVVIFGD